MKVVVVLGYSSKITPKISGYLDTVALQVKELQDQSCPVVLILSGCSNYGNNDFEMSEAAAMLSYLKDRIPKNLSVLIEEESKTTRENLILSHHILYKKWGEVSSENILVFCDACRRFKVRFFAKKIFGKDVKVIGFPITEHLSQKLRQMPATIFDILAFYYPFLYTVKKRIQMLLDH